MSPPVRLALDPDRDPWEQQPGESDLWYARFGTYLETGRTRTLAKVAVDHALSASHVRQYAGPHQWTGRAAAWDAEQVRVFHEHLIDDRVEAARRQIEVGRRWLEFADDAIVAATQLDTPMSVPEAARLAEVSTKLIITATSVRVDAALPATPDDPFAGMTDAERTAAALDMAHMVIRAHEARDYQGAP